MNLVLRCQYGSFRTARGIFNCVMLVVWAEVSVKGIRLRHTDREPVVILQDYGSGRCFGLRVGAASAGEIILEIEGARPVERTTADVIRDVFTVHGISVTRVELYGDAKTRARLRYASAGIEYSLEMNAGDALALAVRMRAPIFAHADLVTARCERGALSEAGASEYLALEPAALR
ncbi:MAG: bifunctional nuclease family protein [Spirochaetaceae bacterium]|nr:MAG: bifunctional nuclease family protein [Spirochaetaceae bacterium]